MKFQEFTKKAALQVQKKLGGEYHVETNIILKNNDVEMTGIIIHGSPPSSVTPNIYLNYFYEQYQNGVPMSIIVEQILDTYHYSSYSKPDKEIPTLEWDSCKDKIIFRLVNRDKNTNLLKNCPFLPYMDLAVTFHYLYSQNEEGIRTIRITNEVLNQWGLTSEDLLMVALKNTPDLFPLKVQPMEDIIRKLIQEECAEQQEDDVDALLDQLLESKKSIPGTWVLTNHSGINGASVLLYPNVLEKLAAEWDSDIFILPSSIHEVILLPDQVDYSEESLTEMVREVNANDVSEDEVLSDHVYRYSLEKRKILF